MSESITYKKEFFDFINELTAINKSIGFERVKDRIVVRKSDADQTLPYIISAPSTYFDIEETVAFYDYSNFYRYLNTLKNPTISIKNEYINIESKSTKINYLLSDEDGIINGPKKVDFEHGDVRFILSKEDIDDIVKTNGLIKGTESHISVNGTTVTITTGSSGSDNSCEKVFQAERVDGGSDEDFEFTIMSNRFDVLPSKRDYCVDLSCESFMRISLIHDELEFNIYSGDIS